MGLSPAMLRWVDERVSEARAILSNPRSTDSQRTVARLVLKTWRAA